MDKYLKPIFITLLFCLMSGIVICLLVIIGLVFNLDLGVLAYGKLDENGQNEMPSSIMGALTILSGGLAVLCARVMKMTDFKDSFDYKIIDWKKSWIPILGCVCFMLIAEAICELLHLPDFMQDHFIYLSSSVIGVFAICFLGPLFEELIFREAIIKCMINNGASSKAAIFFSSFCFGVAHLNPSQMLYAFVVGVVFAIVYVKTGNIIISYLAHVINNSITIACMFIFGNGAIDFHFPTLYYVIILLVLAFPTYKLLQIFYKNDDRVVK